MNQPMNQPMNHQMFNPMNQPMNQQMDPNGPMASSLRFLESMGHISYSLSEISR